MKFVCSCGNPTDNSTVICNRVLHTCDECLERISKEVDWESENEDLDDEKSWDEDDIIWDCPYDSCCFSMNQSNQKSNQNEEKEKVEEKKDEIQNEELLYKRSLENKQDENDEKKPKSPKPNPRIASRNISSIPAPPPILKWKPPFPNGLPPNPAPDAFPPANAASPNLS